MWMGLIITRQSATSLHDCCSVLLSILLVLHVITVSKWQVLHQFGKWCITHRLSNISLSSQWFIHNLHHCYFLLAALLIYLSFIFSGTYLEIGHNSIWAIHSPPQYHTVEVIILLLIFSIRMNLRALEDVSTFASCHVCVFAFWIYLVVV